jgi:apolipoprotein N-acyltransferase
MDTYVPMVEMDPSEGRAVRWFGAVVGAGLFVIGGVWFMAILGYTVPWYTAFPLLAMFVGGFFIVAAYATRKDLRKRG